MAGETTNDGNPMTGTEPEDRLSREEGPRLQAPPCRFRGERP
jgi:hypothetical protein